jgi:myo-inositol-1(or 4)-monophosphatase
LKKPEWLRILRKAGHAGRKAILENYTETSRHKILGKGMGGDMTLRIDKVSENAIHSSLKSELGNAFVFLSEEVGELSPSAKNGELPVVICDPLDGSHNAEIGIPFFAVALSVAIPAAKDHSTERSFGNIFSALITSVKTEDEYYALKGKGAFHNGRRMKSIVEGSPRINTLLIETSDVEYLRERILGKLTKEDINKTRLMGSAAMSYCMLASGAADALIFAQPGGARTIDSPAGFLIASEAGKVFANLTEGSLGIPVEDLGVGFSSRANILGAGSAEILNELKTRLVSLP